MVSRTNNMEQLDFSAVSATTYGLAQQNTRLGHKVAHALSVIEEAIKEYGLYNVALSFNGGKDCTVLMHLVRAVMYRHSTSKTSTAQHNGVGKAQQAQHPLTCLYVLYKRSFAEVEDFVQDSVQRYSLAIHTYDSPMKQGLKRFTEECPQVRAVFIGTRRDDPHGKRLDFFSPTDPDWPAFMRVNPVLDWTFDDIWDFVRAASVHYCRLYDQGYTSLGDVESTSKNPALLKDGVYQPAWSLKNCTLERNGRLVPRSSTNGSAMASPLPIGQKPIGGIPGPNRIDVHMSVGAGAVGGGANVEGSG